MVRQVFTESLFFLAILELFFAYLAYRIQPDLFYIFERLIKPQYLIAGLVLPVIYFILRLVLYYAFI